MSALKTAINSNDHHKGNINAAVNLIEYGDYECPGCKRANLLIKRLLKERDNDLNFIFRNFPQRKFHLNAYSAALAAEAASQQGRFWEMHDLIFENQKQLNNSLLLQLAQDIGLDTVQFANDLTSEKAQNKIELDIQSGVQSGVNGTPTFFINGSLLLTHRGRTYESLLNAVLIENKNAQPEG